MKAKILVIDPSVTIQKVIGIMLSDGPYELASCTKQEEYEEAVQRGPYNIVVLDGHFSDNIIERVKQDLPSAKILAMLGTFDQDNEDDLRRQGADDCIVRPFESGIFVEKCRQLLAEQAAASDAAPAAVEDASAPTAEDASSSTAEILAAGADDIAFAEMAEEPAPVEEVASPAHDASMEENAHPAESASDTSTDPAFAQLDDPDALEDEAFAEMDAPVAEESGPAEPAVASAAAEEATTPHLDPAPAPEAASTDDEAFAEMDLEAEGTSSGVNLDDTLSGWSVNAPTIQPAQAQPTEQLGDDALAKAVAGWGMSVPDVIGASSSEDFTGEIPGVIGEAEGHEAMPAQQDLAYPDEGNKEDSAKILSKLVPISNLEKGEDGEDFEDADRTVSMEINSDMLAGDGLEEEIAQELAGEDFWAPEEEGAAKNATSPAASEVTSTATASAASPAPESAHAAALASEHLTPQLISEIKQAFPILDKAVITEEIKRAMPPLDLQQVSGQMQDLIRPELDKLVQEYCQKTIEHVAWEIIPDLAENLIKQHLESIAEEMKQSSAS